MHALAALDLDAPFRLGRRGAWRPAFLGTQFHVLLWATAAKVCSCFHSSRLFMSMPPRSNSEDHNLVR